MKHNVLVYSSITLTFVNLCTTIFIISTWIGATIINKKSAIFLRCFWRHAYVTSCIIHQLPITTDEQYS